MRVFSPGVWRFTVASEKIHGAPAYKGNARVSCQGTGTVQTRYRVTGTLARNAVSRSFAPANEGSERVLVSRSVPLPSAPL